MVLNISDNSVIETNELYGQLFLAVILAILGLISMEMVKLMFRFFVYVHSTWPTTIVVAKEERDPRFKSLGDELTLTPCTDLEGNGCCYLVHDGETRLGWTRGFPVASLSPLEKHRSNLIDRGLEMTVPGSVPRLLRERPAHCVVFFNHLNNAIGTGFRYKDYIVTAHHVAMHASSWGVLKDGKAKVYPVEERRVRSLDGADVAWMRVPAAQFTVCGVKSLKKTKPLTHSAAVTVEYYDPSDGNWYRTVGNAGDEAGQLMVVHTATTVKGASGSPVTTTGGKWVGVHTSNLKRAQANLLTIAIPVVDHLDQITSSYLYGCAVVKRSGQTPPLCASREVESVQSDDSVIYYRDHYVQFKQRHMATIAGEYDDMLDFDFGEDTSERYRFVETYLNYFQEPGDAIDFIETGDPPDFSHSRVFRDAYVSAFVDFENYDPPVEEPSPPVEEDFGPLPLATSVQHLRQGPTEINSEGPTDNLPSSSDLVSTPDVTQQSLVLLQRLVAQSDAVAARLNLLESQMPSASATSKRSLLPPNSKTSSLTGTSRKVLEQSSQRTLSTSDEIASPKLDSKKQKKRRKQLLMHQAE